MLYTFKQLQSKYSLSVSRGHKGYSSVYVCNVPVSAMAKGEFVFFTFEKREGLLLDGQVPRQPVDKIMWQLGDSLYPFTFKVSVEGKIIGLENVQDIQGRWSAQATNILKETGGSTAVGRYVSAARRNVTDSGKLQRSLLKDSFVNLFLSTYGTGMVFTANNFPYPGGHHNYELVSNEEAEYGKTVMSDIHGNGGLVYNRSVQGELLELDANFSLQDEKGLHRFMVKIKKQ